MVPVADGRTFPLAPHHRRLISASGISAEVCRQRGYATVTVKADLARLGFAPSQRAVPALLIPQYDVRGQVTVYQLRPDTPRIVDGRVLKYEMPKGARLHIDVPPGARRTIGNPASPLYVTEGSRKADSAVSRGLCCVSLAGVWGWRGTNADGGKVALPDWESFALNGRRVRLAFDSDVVCKPSVRAALLRLRDFLTSKGAKVVVVVFPEGRDGTKVGLDDFLASNDVERLDDLCVSSMPTAAIATAQPPALASCQSILTEVVAAAAASGCIGEDVAVQLTYLSVTSRLLAPPDTIVSLAVKGPSSGGKSHLVQTVLGLFPENTYYALTSMSERALAYSDVDLAHRMLVLYEAAGLAGDFGTYLVRSLLSEGRIRYETVEKTTTGLKARTIEREGPTGLITTTTSAALHPENETRLLSITVDDSPAQTHRVMQAIARRAGPTAHLTEWHALQEWLGATGPHRVEVPFAEHLANLIPPVAIRLRRDFSTLLGLIRSHALLHALSRPRSAQGYIVATLADYAAVRGLVAGVLSDGVGATVSDTVRATVEAVRCRLATHSVGAVSVVQVASSLQLDKSAALRRVQVAVRHGYLTNSEERKGRPAKLTMGDPLPHDVTLLPAVETIEAAASGCTVASQTVDIHGESTISPNMSTPDHDPPARSSSPVTAAVLSIFPGSRLIRSRPIAPS